MQIPFDALGGPADICLIGSGAAGLPMAVRLARRGYRVLLCEGGDHDFSSRSQAIYRGEVVGDPYIPLDVARLRYFGGSTNHWGGICRPLEAYDFTAKRAAPTTAWPLARDDLAPYFAEAADILGVSPLAPDRELPGSGLKHIDFSLGPGLPLKQKYAEEVQRLRRLHYCSAANLIGLETVEGRVTAAHFRHYDGRERRVVARHFVLACGGIENSRLLLWCQRRSRDRLLRHPALVGRFWMDHPHATLGEAVLFDPAWLGLDRRVSAFLAPTPATLEERRILNCGLRLHRLGEADSQRLVDDLFRAAPRLGKRLQREGRLPRGVVLRAAWEQEPRPENRIELDTRTDKLGMPRARLIWRKSSLDARTVRESARLLGAYLRDHDLGRLRLEAWLDGETVHFPETGELVGRHHMGGTRMAHSPVDGVVDPDCRLFGQANLYIAGSSVFPSSGHANPTLTLVQLALRLADHLERRLGPP